MIFAADKLVKAIKGKPVTFEVQTVITDCNDFTIQASLSPFVIKDVEGLAVRGETGIWWDHSTKENVEGFKLPSGYEDDVVKKDEKHLKGVYIEGLMMGMPDDFECTSEDVEKEKDRMGNRISLVLTKVIIDLTGFYGDLAVEDVFGVQFDQEGR